jgi:hypothetical protein
MAVFFISSSSLITGVTLRGLLGFRLKNLLLVWRYTDKKKKKKTPNTKTNNNNTLLGLYQYGTILERKHALIWIRTHHPSFQAVLDVSMHNANLSKPYGYYTYHLLEQLYFVHTSCVLVLVQQTETVPLNTINHFVCAIQVYHFSVV